MTKFANKSQIQCTYHIAEVYVDSILNKLFVFIFIITPYLIARYMSNVTARATIDREQPT